MGFGKKCSNCRQNPCTSSCAKQEYPARSSMRPDNGRQASSKDIRKDNAYQAAKARQDAEGRPNSVRHLTAKQIARGDMKKFAGMIERSEHDGDGMKIILTKGNEGRLREYE